MSTLDDLFGPDDGRCGAWALLCVCNLPVHDVGVPHVCHSHIDGGPRCKLWRGHWDDDTFEPVVFPGGEPACPQ